MGGTALAVASLVNGSHPARVCIVGMQEHKEACNEQAKHLFLVFVDGRGGAFFFHAARGANLRRCEHRATATTLRTGPASPLRVRLGPWILALEWPPIRVGVGSLDPRAPRVPLAAASLGGSQWTLVFRRRPVGTRSVIPPPEAPERRLKHQRRN